MTLNREALGRILPVLICLLVVVVWVIFGINMFGTLLKRNVSHIYVAIWFYIATWVTVAPASNILTTSLPE